MPKESPEEQRYRSDYAAMLKRIDNAVSEWPATWLSLYGRKVFEEEEDVRGNGSERKQQHRAGDPG